MKIPMVSVISIFILVLIGFGERCEANDINAFVKACLSSRLNWEKPKCECAAKEADERLTPTGFEFVVATLKNDQAKMAELLSQLDENEQLDANLFIPNCVEYCGE